LEFTAPRRQILCRSYTRSPVRSSNTPSSLLTPILIAPATARSAKQTSTHSAWLLHTHTHRRAFDGIIRVRRYLCQACQRTVSLLPEFILPYLRSSVMVIALFLIARLLRGQTLEGATATAPPPMPYQRGQFWIRRFRAQAESAVRRAGCVDPTGSRADFVHRALTMIESTGLDRRSPLPVCRRARPPAGLAPRSSSHGRRAAFSSAGAPA